MITSVQALIYLDDDGKEVRVPLDAFDNEIDMNPMDQLQGILKAVRYILGTEEGDSILAQAVTVHRRYTMAWPDFKRLTALSQMDGAQICRTYRDGGYVFWWEGHNFPPIREALDKAIRNYEREERDGKPSREGTLSPEARRAFERSRAEDRGLTDEQRLNLELRTSGDRQSDADALSKRSDAGEGGADKGQANPEQATD